MATLLPVDVQKRHLAVVSYARLRYVYLMSPRQRNVMDGLEPSTEKDGPPTALPGSSISPHVEPKLSSRQAPDEPRALEPVNGNNLPYGFPDSTVRRALVLMLGSKSVRHAHRLLSTELEVQGLPVPAYETLWLWAKQSEECYTALTGESKREMVAISTDAARAWGANMIELADSDAAMRPTEVGINFGILMQRRTDWENAGTKAPQVAVQFNFRTRED